MNLFALILVGIAAVIGVVLVLILANFFGVWLRAKIADAPVAFAKLIGMRLRRVPVGLIVDSRITAVKAGLPLETDSWRLTFSPEATSSHVVLALIAADKAGITLDFNRACAIDLAIKGTSKTVLGSRAHQHQSEGRSTARILSSPAGGSRSTRVARDGIGVKVRARVTVRSNLDRFVGGATEETIIARGRRRHRNIDRFRGFLQGRSGESRPHFEGRTPKGPRQRHRIRNSFGRHCRRRHWRQRRRRSLQAEQAEADKVVAQAKAEMRRAAAVASEQEMKARTQEMRAKVVEAEAQVPSGNGQKLPQRQPWRHGLS
mgnify:CR=1 FL=1